MKPRKGQHVQVHCDGRDLIGRVFMEITEPSIVLQAPSGSLFIVPLKGSTFTAEGAQDDEIPLPDEPPDR